MERETEAEPDIDQTAPGSDTDAADGVASQMTYEDMLEDHVTDDVLDEGYSPPDYPPSVDVPTRGEQRRGADLDTRLSEEEPDAGEEVPAGSTPSSAGAARSGRLQAPDDGGRTDDVMAQDAGIAGGAASAEEAAVHTVEEESDR